MKTIHSILLVSALFATFMAIGMEQAPLAQETADSNNCSFVQDSESLRLMLLYHNPVRGLASAPCGNAQPRLSIVAG